MDLRKCFVKTLVWPVVLYGCETWTMRKEEVNRVNAFGRLNEGVEKKGKVSRMDKGTNKQVLRSMSEKKSLIKRYRTERRTGLDML